MNNILQKLQNLLVPFVMIALFIRIFETIALASNPSVGSAVILPELAGFGVDLLIIWVFLIVYLAWILLFRKYSLFVKVFISAAYVLYALLSVGLSSYFQLLLYPLDKVVFSFPFSEIVHIAYGSSQDLPRAVMPFAGVLIVGTAGLWLAPRIKLCKPCVLLLAFVACATGLAQILGISMLRIDSKIGYYASENRVAQLLRFNDNAVFKTSSDLDQLPDNVKLFHSIHPEHRFISEEYPLLHEEDYGQDVLAPFFDSIKQKPNVVFIIVESLASSICGPNAKNGSCTPYLDKLIERSLYWENHYSTAERTFEVFPSSLGSLPHGNEGFTRLANMPNHLTLIKLLGRNGYHTSFHHPTDFKIYFDNWWRFFSLQGIDAIYDIHAFPKLPGFNNKNGDPDEILFSHADSCMRALSGRPHFSILLTTSMHEPFIIPEQREKEAAAIETVKANSALSQRQKDIMQYNIARTAAVAYTDAQIGKFIEGYRSHPQFANTIFVIFGDHSVYNYDPHHQAEQYRVPLIIYSPLIKHPRRFEGINSHLDITPTLLCLLKNACELDLPRYTHWIGHRLDTSSVQGQGKRIPFMSVSRICKDYLRGNDYISGQDLYRYEHSSLYKQDNPLLYGALIQELATYMYVNHYVCTQNKLVPDSVYYAYSNKIKTVESASVAVKPDMDPTQEFFEFQKSVFADSSIKNYTARLRFKMKCEKTGLYEVPRLIVAGNDAASGESLCYQLEFLSRQDLSPLASNEWQDIVVSQSTNFVNNTADSINLSVYLWNPSRTPIYYKDVHYELIGVCK